MKWASWITFLAGLWLIIAPFVLRYATKAATTEDVILGILIAAFSLWAATAVVGTGAAWLVALFGVWVVIAPFVLGYSGATPRTTSNDVITGIVVFVFALIRAVTRVGRPTPPLA